MSQAAPLTTATSTLASSQENAAQASVVGLWGPSRSLWRREMVRFFRQRSRVTGAFLTPIVFWLLLGSGLNNNFVLSGSGAAEGSAQALQKISYLGYFFPGTVVMILLFTAIFSTISVIEDRKEGFMQAVLVSPTPRLSIVLGKVMGCATIATIQGILFLLAWPFVSKQGFDGPLLLRLLGAVGVMFVLGMGLAGLGLCLAWKMSSTAGFHAIMNLFLMPMWFLCGAVFPVPESGALRVIMLANPLTYGQSTFSMVLTGEANPINTPGPLWLSPVVMVAFTVGLLFWAGRMVSKPRKDGLP